TRYSPLARDVIPLRSHPPFAIAIRLWTRSTCMNGCVRGIAVAAIISVTMGAVPAGAADWPTKTVRVVVPYAAGSATDLIPRTVFEAVPAQTGPPFVVENRLGGGTTVATQAVAKPEPDGHTILNPSNALVTVPAIQPNVPYDPVRDFAG